MTLSPCISLSFNGQCEAAFRFYERCLGGKIEFLLTWGDSPMAKDVPTEWSGKLVHAFALETDFDLSQFASNAFTMEWPPKSGRREHFPEIDRIAYFALPLAQLKIIAYQLPLLAELERRVGATHRS